VLRSNARSRRKASLADASFESISRRLRSHLGRVRREPRTRSCVAPSPHADQSFSARLDSRDLVRKSDPANYRPTGSAPVRLARRLLLRLLYPLLEGQHELAAANAAAADDARARVADLDRRVRAAGLKVRHLDVDFKAYEDELRGDEEWVKQHQARYVSHFEGARDVLDVGCGRGEFLECLREWHVPALGIDRDAAMVAHCRRKGFSVEQADALAFLAALEPASIGGIFCAEVIEHLEAADVVDLLDLCARVLQPGAALVLESPNPESLIVFSGFFQDVTHVRPYDPRSLVPLLRARGFRDIDVDYSLRPDPALWIPPLPFEMAEALPELDNSLRRLDALMYGPMAYAIVARRGDEEAR
jgi:2-polyprenyl-3-methyl-5-hydroxy-6-metoxy-1,4-benzoquinol methylase